MIRKFFVSVLLCGQMVSQAQEAVSPVGSLNIVSGAKSSSALSAVGSLNIARQVKPAILNVVAGSVEFVDPNGNNAIDANEMCRIRFKVTNKGMGDGFGCKLLVKASGTIAGLNYKSEELPVLKRGEVCQIDVPVVATMATQNGKVEFVIKVEEPNGFGTDPVQLSVSTRAFEAPLLKVADYSVTGTESKVLERKKPFDLQILLQNTQYGVAENVRVGIELPRNVWNSGIDGNENVGTMKAGETKQIVYSLIVNNEYVGTSIPIKVHITEKYGRYAEDKVINLDFKQSLSGSKIDVKEKHQVKSSIEAASLSSKVDKNIPRSDVKNNDTYVVIVANENYNRVEDVPYALNDGNVFRQYCEQTLGIPAKNIKFLSNATLGDMKAEINWLRDVVDATDGVAKVVFYYAGHGIPSEDGNKAYLLPVDGYGTDVSTAYRLDDLYAALSYAPSKQVAVFLDACFSGSQRDGQMISSARGVAMKTKRNNVKGSMVVFSAASADETALAFDSEKHGMFTYFLLEKLQATQGNVGLKDLGDYVIGKVRRTSLEENHKKQTPTVVPAPGLNGWENWRLK